MTFSGSVEQRWGLPVVDYDPDKGLREAGREAYRVRTDHDADLRSRSGWTGSCRAAS